MISRARFGPDRAQIGGCFDAPNSCLMTSLIRVPVSISRPFTALTMTVSWSMKSMTFLTFSRRVLEGTARIVRSAPPRASAGSGVTRMADGKDAPGRYWLFSLASRRRAPSFSVRARRRTEWPSCAVMIARVVPQPVVPTTPTVAIGGPSRAEYPSDRERCRPSGRACAHPLSGADGCYPGA